MNETREFRVTKDVRRHALEALYQFDLRGEEDAAEIRDGLERDERAGVKLTREERDAAFELALAAHQGRGGADEETDALAPHWPATRRPAMDRSIIRLAHHELRAGRTNGKIVVNEAVELAKLFGSEKSPGFVNALLDKILKGVTPLPTPEPGTAPAAEPPAL